jgi:hypothetical protein
VSSKASGAEARAVAAGVEMPRREPAEVEPATEEIEPSKEEPARESPEPEPERDADEPAKPPHKRLPTSGRP